MKEHRAQNLNDLYPGDLLNTPPRSFSAADTGLAERVPFNGPFWCLSLTWSSLSVCPLITPNADGASSPFPPWEPDCCSHTLDPFGISTCELESLGGGHGLRGEAGCTVSPQHGTKPWALLLMYILPEAVSGTVRRAGAQASGEWFSISRLLGPVLE